ncbi:efflux RND transporter periplasmic adaptor subunit [Myxococcaceae bacterium GXIMD 01537]
MTRTALLAALVAGPLLGCSSPTPAPPVPPPSRGSAPTAWVHPRPVRGAALTDAPARVLAPPEGAAALGAPFRASVTRLAVRPGQPVKRGDALVEVLMPEVVRAAGDYEAATLRREAYTRRHEQLQALQAQGLARLVELSEVETQLAEARSAQLGALAVLRVAGLEAGAAAGVASRGTVPLRSPVDGVVTEVLAVLGETRESGGEPLVRVVGGGEARIEARLAHALPEAAGFEFHWAGGEPVPVRLVNRAPVVDSRDGTTAAWFEPEPARALPAGLLGTVRVRAETLPDVKVVPSRALVLEMGRAEVLVREGEGFRRQEVRVVSTSGADALVRGALGEADAVAADAAALLSAGGGAE